MDEYPGRGTLREQMRALLDRKNRNWPIPEMEKLAEGLVANARSVPMPQVPKLEAPNKDRRLTYFRGLGSVSFVIGVARMVPSRFFWFQTCCVYVAAVLFFIDFSYEKWNQLVRSVAILLLLVAVAAFSRYMVFVQAPMSLVALKAPLDHGTGDMYAGIPWQPYFTDVRLSIMNTSEDIDYSDFDFTVVSDQSMVYVGNSEDSGATCRQIPGPKGQVTVSDAFVTHVDPQSGKEFTEPFKTGPDVVVNPGYRRIVCDRLAAGSSLEIVLAFVTISEIQGETFDPNKRKAPTYLTLDGTYFGFPRTRTISNKPIPVPIRRP